MTFFQKILSAYSAQDWPEVIAVGEALLADLSIEPQQRHYYWLAFAHKKRGNEASAAEIYKRALTRFPGNRDLRLRVLAHSFRCQAWPEVISLGTSLLDDEQAQSNVFHWLAFAHEKLGDETSASQVYRRAIKLQPDTALFHYRLGLLLQKQSQWEEAADSMRRAMELESSNEAWRQRLENMEAAAERIANRQAREVFRQALAAEKDGDHASAEQSYRHAIKLQPDNRDLRRRFLVRKYQSRDWPEVIALGMPLLDGEQTRPNVFYWIARAHLQTGQDEQAAQIYERALARFPDNRDLRLRVLRNAVRSAEWDKIARLAEICLEDGLAAVPENFYIPMMRALRRAGLPEKAQTLLDQFTKTFPDNDKEVLRSEIIILTFRLRGESPSLDLIVSPPLDKCYRQEIADCFPVLEFGSCTPGRPDWIKKWRATDRSKRVVMVAPKDFSGSMYKLAEGINRFSEYAARLVVFTPHQFGYRNDLVVPEAGPARTKRFEQDLKDAAIVHLKDEQSWFLKTERTLNLHILENIILGRSRASLKTVFTAYGGYARSLAADPAWRTAVSSFDAYTMFTPDLEFDWLKGALLPHSIDTHAIKPAWCDNKLLVHSSSTVRMFRKGTDLLCSAISSIETQGFQAWQDWQVDMYTGVSHKLARSRQQSAGLYFDQAGREPRSLTKNGTVIGWYGNAAIECMAMGIPTMVHLDSKTLRRAQSHGVQLEGSGVLNVTRDHRDIASKIMRFVGSSPVEREKLSKQTREFCVANHGYKSVAARAEHVYDAIV